MPSMLTKVKEGLTHLWTPQEPHKPDTGAYQAIVEKEQVEGRLLSTQEIQDLTGWDQTQLSEAAPGLSPARSMWKRYLQELDIYQRKMAKRQAPAQTKGPGHPLPETQEEALPAQTQTISEILTPAGRSFADLTADELSARRRSILANTPFDLPLHRKMMNGIKETWRMIGPLAFVVFTVWEVFYFMNHFLQAESVFDVVLLWGISLIIEIPFMIATYDQSERRERAAERKARGEPDTIPGKVSSLIFWCLLALVNVAGQISFLSFVTHAGFQWNDPSVIGLWFFIILRVTGVIIGDCYTAFHLLPTEAPIERVLRAQQAQMDGERQLADSDAERLRKSAESDAMIERIRLSVERDQREAQFMEDWQKMNMAQTLERQRRFMELERHQLKQLPIGDETGDL